MAEYDTSDFKTGLKIEIDGEPYNIVDFQHVKPGKGNQFTRTKIRNLLTGRVLERTLKSGEKVGKPDMESQEVQYLYDDGESSYFMNTSTYEQFPIADTVLGEVKYFLKVETKVNVLFYNGRPINVEPPIFVYLTVTEAEPGIKGDTASGATKPVVLETGYRVNVPLFINQGDILKIDTRTGDYTDRVKK